MTKSSSNKSSSNKSSASQSDKESDETKRSTLRPFRRLNELDPLLEKRKQMAAALARRNPPSLSSMSTDPKSSSSKGKKQTVRKNYRRKTKYTIKDIRKRQRNGRHCGMIFPTSETDLAKILQTKYLNFPTDIMKICFKGNQTNETFANDKEEVNTMH